MNIRHTLITITLMLICITAIANAQTDPAAFPGKIVYSSSSAMIVLDLETGQLREYRRGNTNFMLLEPD